MIFTLKGKNNKENYERDQRFKEAARGFETNERASKQLGFKS